MQKINTEFFNAVMRRRVLMTVLGIGICGLSIGFFSYSELGLDPYQVLCHGLWGLTNLSFGFFYSVMNVLVLLVIFVVNRRKIGLGTVLNLFLIGYIAEFSEGLLRAACPSPAMPIRVVSLVFGIVVMCLSSALYFTADLGVSPYDAVAITIDERTGDRLQFRFIRIGTDLVCVIVGGLLGGVFGVGTLITAFFMGPLIAFFNKTVAIPMLEHRDGK